MSSSPEDIEMGTLQGPSTSAAETSPRLQKSNHENVVQIDERSNTNDSAGRIYKTVQKSRRDNEYVGDVKNTPTSTPSNQFQAIPNEAELDGKATQCDHPELLSQTVEHKVCTLAEVVDYGDKSDKSSDHDIVEQIVPVPITDEPEKSSLREPPTTVSRTLLDVHPVQNEDVNEADERSNSSTTSGIDNETLEIFHDAVDREDISRIETTLKSMFSGRRRMMLLNSHRPGDEYGEAALHRASKNNKFLLAKFLIGQGASVIGRDNHGKTPLHHAVINYKNQSGLASAFSREPTISDPLTEAGGDVSAQDDDGRTSLHHAALNNNQSSAELLMKLSANVNVRSKSGTTGLHNFAQYSKSQSAVQSSETDIGRTIFDVLIEAGADVNAQDDRTYTPLHIAAGCNNIFSTMLLLKHGASVADRDNNGRTPLHHASIYYSREFRSPDSNEKSTIFDVLIEAGADVNARDNDGYTPLLGAVVDYTVASSKLLIEHGDRTVANPVDDIERLERSIFHNDEILTTFREAVYLGDLLLVENTLKSMPSHQSRVMLLNTSIPGGAGEVALHQAVSTNKIVLAKFLIEQGANVNKRNNFGATSLHYIHLSSGAPSDSPDTTQQCAMFYVLAEAGADINAPDKHGRTPLHYAAAKNSLFSIMLLLNNGANVNVRDKDGCTFLHAACHLKSGSALDSLPSSEVRTMFDVVTRARVDVNAQDNDGWTPLHHAVTKNNISLAKLLIEYGANVDIRDMRRSTPLHCFAGYSKSESKNESSEIAILDLLIAAGADVNAQNVRGDTPLHVAVKWQNESIVERLLTLPGIKPNMADEEGYLALHLAIKSSCKSNIIRMLLDAVLQRRELTWNLTTPNGESPLHVALQHDYPNLVTQILDKLCIRTNLVRVNDTDADGQTALHYACERGLFEICVLLLKNGAVKDLDVRSKDEGRRPFDFAIARGFEDICELISEYEPNLFVDAEVLSSACFWGHVETVRWCINNCTINLDVKKEEEKSFFREAIENKQEQVAKYIIQESPLWRDVLCERNITNDGILHTPMRELIRTMPDVARQALNRCTLFTSPEVHFVYALIDDAYSKWKPEVHVWDGKDPKGSRNYQDRRCLNSSPYTNDARVLQDNHVVSLMVKYNRDDLIIHPVVSTLIEQKWRKFGYKVLLASFICYSLFLANLTIYSTAVAPVNSLYYLNKTLLAPFWKADKCNNFTTNVPFKADISNETDVCRVFENRSSTFNCNIVETGGVSSINHFILHHIRFVLLFCSIALLAAKLSYLYAKHKFEDVLACCVYAMTIAVTLPWRGFGCMYRFGLLESWAWQVASINILLAYILLALKLEFAPGLAIYVHLLKNVSTTMLRVLAGPFGIMLIASASCFHMIFKASVRHDQFVKLLVNDPNDQSDGWVLNPFYSFPKAVLKTLVMLIGEYDLETHFMANDVTVAPIMLMFLVLFGTIALMNLLIGLATSDVGARAQEQAEVQQLKMQITCSLEVERLIRSSFIGKYSYFKKLLQSDVDSVYNSDGFHLENWPYNELRLVHDPLKILHEPLKILWKLLVLCYRTIFLDPRYAKKFSERLKIVQMEQIKSAEHARTRKSAKDVRWTSKAAEDANKAKILTEEVSRIKVLVEEISRVKIEHGKAPKDLAK